MAVQESDFGNGCMPMKRHLTVPLSSDFSDPTPIAKSVLAATVPILTETITTNANR